MSCKVWDSLDQGYPHYAFRFNGISASHSSSGNLESLGFVLLPSKVSLGRTEVNYTCTPFKRRNFFALFKSFSNSASASERSGKVQSPYKILKAKYKANAIDKVPTI